MPRLPTPPRSEDELHQVCVRIPGWLKGRMLAICEREGISINAFVSNPLFQNAAPSYLELAQVIRVSRLDGPSVAEKIGRAHV